MSTPFLSEKEQENRPFIKVAFAVTIVLKEIALRRAPDRGDSPDRSNDIYDIKYVEKGIEDKLT